MVAQTKPVVMSADEYLVLERASEERHEYIDGQVSAMAGGTADHGALSLSIGSSIRSLLRGSPCRAHPSDVRVPDSVSATRYVYPDLSVSCEERDRGQVEEILFPRLIVEVLSPSTEAYDRGDKFGYYRRCPTIQEYMLVNARRREVEIYRRAGDLWTLRICGPSDHVELAGIGIRFTVAEVYEGIALPSEGNNG